VSTDFFVSPLWLLSRPLGLFPGSKRHSRCFALFSGIGQALGILKQAAANVPQFAPRASCCVLKALTWVALKH